MRVVSDRSGAFVRWLAASWALAVALPLLLSIALARPARGLPVVLVLLWFVGLRVARYLSPAVLADRQMRRGRAQDALARCDAALAVAGPGAWVGTRRLAWLNRRTRALLALGESDRAAFAALDALSVSADPETIGLLALTLLRLNRYDEAAEAARLALSLTRERSVLGHAVLAWVMLASDRPAEAEALASAGIADMHMLLAAWKPEHELLCLAALARAQRVQARPGEADDALRRLRRAAGDDPTRTALLAMVEADARAGTEGALPTVLALLRAAMADSPHIALWYISQPETFVPLYASPGGVPRPGAEDAPREFAGLVRDAEAMFARQNAAPQPQRIAEVLAAAREQAVPRPAPQSSRTALVAQVATLAGTLFLLLWWAVRFFFQVQG